MKKVVICSLKQAFYVFEMQAYTPTGTMKGKMK